jgi:transcriptional regulator with XRE-family HTH domain
MAATSRARFSQTFNRILRRRRLDRGLSQEALSELADVDRTYVGLLERGKRAPGLDISKRLAAALGVPLSELIAEAEREWEATAPRLGRRRH